MTEKSKEETLRRKLRRRAKKGEEVDGDINNFVAKHSRRDDGRVKDPNLRNYVAKSMNKFNKPKRHADLTKDHDRKDRYKRWKFGEDDEV